jgi:peptide chain release factor 3
VDVQEANTIASVIAEAGRRRTFAIISHPDAGKTTLTEKFLLYAGEVAEAGAVKARAGRRTATSDWMAMEQQRGISIASTVLQFTYNDAVVNLLDTPGHRDFSEDTYRVLAAVDAAVMVLDVAKGIETQTLKLFEVCRARNLPILTFLNKYDRPGKSPLALLDEIETQISLRPTPMTWPVGDGENFRGVIDRTRNEFVRFTRSSHGSTVVAEERLSFEDAAKQEGDAWEQAMEEIGLLDAVGAIYDETSFLAGETSPLFVGSAMTNFGVRHLLDAVVGLIPSPTPRIDADGNQRDLGAGCSGFVFKIQANMDPGHRDHVAFVRMCSGRFERGMSVTHQPSGKQFSTKHAAAVSGADRNTIDEAYPGDVVGLVNASDLRIGDTMYVGKPVAFPRIPVFAPELFARVAAKDTGRHKQYRSGIAQLGREGVVQILKDPLMETVPIAAAVGQMQFEVLEHRMKHEFGAEVMLTYLPFKVAARTDEATAKELEAYRSSKVMVRDDGMLLALFESEYFLIRLRNDHPEWCLESVMVD